MKLPTAVAQWLRYYAAKPKVTGSIPAPVDIFLMEVNLPPPPQNKKKEYQVGDKVRSGWIKQPCACQCCFKRMI